MASDGKATGAGIVYLIGAGPGDPELVTAKGLRLLAECDVVLYDYLVPAELLDSAPADAERIYVGKQGRMHSIPQAEINDILLDRAKKGKTVARLKGGDPFVFGRGGEEAEFLASRGVAFELVPGVSSASAAAAYAGIPLTHREITSSVVILTGHEDPAKPSTAVKWKEAAQSGGTIVVLMGMRRLGEITTKLIDGGLDPATPAAVVQWGTCASQRTVVAKAVNIASEAAREGLKAPAVIVIGKVVAFREKLKWFEARPLFGRRIVVTRARGQAGALSSILKRAGAYVIETPTIEIVPTIDLHESKKAVAAVGEYDWIVLTSVNGVKYFFEALDAAGLDSRSLGGKKFAAIGPATAAALKEKGFRADVTPKEFKAEGLLEMFDSASMKGAKILIARAEEAREVLPEELAKMGAKVTVAAMYRSIPPLRGADMVRAMLGKNRPDMITFASSSTVKNFMKMAEGLDLKGVAIASIGPITSDTCRELGLEVAVQPAKYTIPDLVEAIVKHYAKT